MAYTILITKRARKDIETLDTVIRKQLGKKLQYFGTLDDIKTVAKKLENSDTGAYRLRVGNYRMIFDLEKKAIVLLRVQHRKDVYR